MRGISEKPRIHTEQKRFSTSSSSAHLHPSPFNLVCNMASNESAPEEPLKQTRSGSVLPRTLITEAKNIECVGFGGTIHGVKSSIICLQVCLRFGVCHVGHRWPM